MAGVNREERGCGPGGETSAQDATSDAPHEQRSAHVQREVRQMVAPGVLSVEEPIGGESEHHQRTEVLDRQTVRRPPRARRVDRQHPTTSQRLAQSCRHLDVKIVVCEERGEQGRQQRERDQRDERSGATEPGSFQTDERVGACAARRDAALGHVRGHPSAFHAGRQQGSAVT
jgi:hypothetical protein